MLAIMPARSNRHANMIRPRLKPAHVIGGDFEMEAVADAIGLCEIDGLAEAVAVAHGDCDGDAVAGGTEIVGHGDCEALGRLVGWDVGT